MNCAHRHQTVAAVVLSCPCGSALSERRSVPWCKLLSAPVCWTCCFVAQFISTATANKQSKADLQALLSMQRDRHVYEFTEIQFLMYLVIFQIWWAEELLINYIYDLNGLFLVMLNIMAYNSLFRWNAMTDCDK